MTGIDNSQAAILVHDEVSSKLGGVIAVGATQLLSNRRFLAYSHKVLRFRECQKERSSS
jgi:hypothetical protein